tara:strand:- start:659 stop:826 length:168 start_codon:yes stop_codon:yes gene_type:complete
MASGTRFGSKHRNAEDARASYHWHKSEVVKVEERPLFSPEVDKELRHEKLEHMYK